MPRYERVEKACDLGFPSKAESPEGRIAEVE